MAEKAILLNPSNLYHRLNLVQYLIWAGNNNEASKSLESLIKADTYGQYSAEIIRLKESLEKYYRHE
jgi:hypothetical protein